MFQKFHRRAESNYEDPTLSLSRRITEHFEYFYPKDYQEVMARTFPQISFDFNTYDDLANQLRSFAGKDLVSACMATFEWDGYDGQMQMAELILEVNSLHNFEEPREPEWSELEDKLLLVENDSRNTSCDEQDLMHRNYRLLQHVLHDVTEDDFGDLHFPNEFGSIVVELCPERDGQISIYVENEIEDREVNSIILTIDDAKRTVRASEYMSTYEGEDFMRQLYAESVQKQLDGYAYYMLSSIVRGGFVYVLVYGRDPRKDELSEEYVPKFDADSYKGGVGKEELLKVARVPDTPAVVLSVFSKLSSAEVREIVAGNPSISLSDLRILKEDKDAAVRKAACANSKMVKEEPLDLRINVASKRTSSGLGTGKEKSRDSVGR